MKPIQFYWSTVEEKVTSYVFHGGIDSILKQKDGSFLVTSVRRTVKAGVSLTVHTVDVWCSLVFQLKSISQ